MYSFFRNVFSTCKNVVLGPKIYPTMKQGVNDLLQCRFIQSSSPSTSFGCLQGKLSTPCVKHNNLLNASSCININQVRYLKQPRHTNKKIQYPYYKYKFSSWKRIHKFGLEARLSSVSQKKVLWRRVLKGRPYLTVCDRILDHSNRTVPNREKIHLQKVGKKNNYPLYSYKAPLFKFRGD